jgi:hypothetical protein
VAVKTYRVALGGDAIATGELVSYGTLSETDQTAANRTDGWTVGKIAAGNSDDFDPGTKLTTAGLNLESSFPCVATIPFSSATVNAFRTPTTLTGTFAATAWTFTFALRATTVSAQRGRIHIAVWKAGIAAPTTGQMTQLVTKQIGTTTAVLSTTADVTSVVTWTPSSFTLSNEYLFICVGWEITTAGGSNGCDVVIRTGQAAGGSQLVTSDLSAGGAAAKSLVAPDSRSSRRGALPQRILR